MKKENPFSVPGNYFNSLPDRVLANISKKETRASLLERLEKIFHPWLESMLMPRLAATGTFAAIIIAIGLYFYRTQPISPTGHFETFASLSDEEVNAYISNNLDEYELAAFNGESNFSGNIFTTGNISNDELDNYILNNIDEQTLEEEFL